MALAKRNVELQVAWQLVKIHPPKLGGERQQGAIEGWCIRCWEASPAPESKE